jgi:hypothetical protein
MSLRLNADWPIENLPGLNATEQNQLLDFGISTTGALFKHRKMPETTLALASKLQVHLQYVNKWIALGD